MRTECGKKGRQESQCQNGSASSSHGRGVKTPSKELEERELTGKRLSNQTIAGTDEDTINIMSDRRNALPESSLHLYAACPNPSTDLIGDGGLR